MSRFAKMFAANAIAAAGLCSAAVALSASASADPVMPPSVPGLNMIQQLATNPAGVGAVLQTAATALNGASGMLGAPSPNTLPVSPIEGVPGYPAPAAPYLPATAPLPAAQVAGPVAGPAQMVGPLLNQLGVPANLVGLAPNLPLLNPSAALTPAAAPAPVAPVVPVAPVAPVAPVVPVAPAVSAAPNPLLNALP